MPQYGVPQPYDPFLNRLPNTTPSSSGDVALWRGTTPTPSPPAPSRTATPSPAEIRQEQGIQVYQGPPPWEQEARPQVYQGRPPWEQEAAPPPVAPSTPTARPSGTIAALRGAEMRGEERGAEMARQQQAAPANDSGAIPGMRPPAGPLLPTGQPSAQGTPAAEAADRAASGGGAGGGTTGPVNYGPEAFEPGAVANWSDQDVAQITEATVGRAMSRDEFFRWVDEFTREHGQTPWQTGPFDAANNLIDHLIALGDSQRQAGRGQTVDWGGLYYNRYAAPTFTPGAPPNPRGDEPWQRLAPGQMANPLHPWWLMQGAMGNPGWYAGIRRPWFGG